MIDVAMLIRGTIVEDQAVQLEEGHQAFGDDTLTCIAEAAIAQFGNRLVGPPSLVKDDSSAAEAKHPCSDVLLAQRRNVIGVGEEYGQQSHHPQPLEQLFIEFFNPFPLGLARRP